MVSDVNKPTLGTKVKNVCLVLNPPRRIPVRRTLVVLGVERGGTSMVAGVLRALGVPMGDRAGLNHEDPAFLKDDPDKLRRAIRTRNKQHDMWGFKVPKASLMLDFYEETLRTPFYVAIYRNSMSVVDSWQQRGAADSPVGVLRRIAAYHDAILAMAEKTGAPVLFVNYERAVADEASKRQLVEEMAGFAGIELDHDIRARAMSMMTGDGKGYVNLPEHYFLVKPDAGFGGTRPDLPLVEKEPENRGTDGWVECDKPRPKLIFGLADGANLPRRFWLEVDLQAEGLTLAENPVRFFFNFTGEYFPGHCARPVLRPGYNLFWVETSGKASDIGFGPISVPARLKIGARAYTATEADAPDTGARAEGIAARPEGKRGLGARIRGKVLGDGS